MSFFVNIGDVWKSGVTMKLNISDTWKSVENGFINIGDVWKKFYRASGLTYTTTANTAAYYKFENNLLDSGPNGYNGTSGSTTSYSTGYIDTYSIKMSGTTSATSYTNKVIPNGAKTISFWFKNDSTLDYSVIVSNNGIFSPSSGTTIFVQNSKYWVFQVRSGENYFEVNGGAANAENSWQHYVATWDGTTNANGIKNYLNGVLVKQGTSTFTETATTTYNMKMGQSPSDPTRNLRGWLDEMIIENRAWSATEVSDYYYKYKI